MAGCSSLGRRHHYHTFTRMHRARLGAGGGRVALQLVPDDMAARVGGHRHISEGTASHCGGGCYLGQGMATDTRVLPYRQHGGGSNAAE